jgi:hypothetical protein
LGEDDPEEVCNEEFTREFVSPDKATSAEPVEPKGPSLPPKDRLVLSENDVNKFEGGFLARSSDPKDRRKRRVETVGDFFSGMVILSWPWDLTGFEFDR